MTTGLWVAASFVLGRDIPVDGPYPHICGVEVTGRMTARRYRVWTRDCAACAETTGGRP